MQNFEMYKYFTDLYVNYFYGFIQPPESFFFARQVTGLRQRGATIILSK